MAQPGQRERVAVIDLAATVAEWGGSGQHAAHRNRCGCTVAWRRFRRSRRGTHRYSDPRTVGEEPLRRRDEKWRLNHRHGPVAAATTPSQRFRPCSMTTSESWNTCAAFIGWCISRLGAAVWQQHHPLLSDEWKASVGWPLAVVPGIRETGRCRFHGREGRQFSPNVHVDLSTTGALVSGKYPNGRYVEMGKSLTSD